VPALREGKLPKQLDIKDAFEVVHGLPRAKWKLLRERVCQVSGKDQPTDEDWSQIQRHWLKDVGKAAGTEFGIIESPRFMLLAPRADEAEWMLQIAEEAQDKVIAALGARPAAPIVGKIPILKFMGEALYRQHVRYYTVDDKPGNSDGICIRDHGEIHVALPALRTIRTVLPHELVHVHLGALRLPVWLNEGVAQIVARRWKYDLTAELESEARLYWRTRGLQQFWSGEAWNAARPGEGVAFAYIFSERLTKDIRALGESDFKRFLNAADVRDAGEAACQQVYGFGLQVWVQKLLGAGDWTPKGEFPTSEIAPGKSLGPFVGSDQVETGSAAAATSSTSRLIFQST
jgi:hypothetical protein